MAQFKRVWLGYELGKDVDSSTGSVISITNPTDGEDTEKGDTEI